MPTLSIYVLAQNALGNDYAKIILDESIDLSQKTAESWSRIWDITVSPEVALWQAIVELGAFIAAMAVVYLALSEASKLIDNPTWRKLIAMFRFPLFILILLGGNGYFLAGAIRTVRSIAYFWLSKILEMTFAGISINEALQKIQNTNIANGRAREIFADCIDKTALALEECLNDPQKQEQVQEMLGNLPVGNGEAFDGNLLEAATNFTQQTVTTLISAAFLPSIETFLIGLQWAFVNGIEVALFLTAMYAPIAVGLSMIPNAGPSIIAWFSGFMGLFMLQIGYVLVVGITANILALTEQEGQAINTTITDLAFLLFLSLVAPIIASLIAAGGGKALFDGISRTATTIARLTVGAATGGTSLAAQTAAKSLATSTASSALAPKQP